nr:MAG TPA: hypothetical protein [Caudoviricetes sp.]
MAKNSGTTRTSRPKKAADTDVRQRIPQIQKILNDRSKTNYQKITAIDRTSLAKFAKTLPQHIKDMTNVDISKAIAGTHRKLGGYIDVNFHKLKPNDARAVKSYLTKMGYSYEENGATNTAINFKRNYKGK